MMGPLQFGGPGRLPHLSTLQGRACTAVVWLYEPTASIPLCGEKEIEDIIPVRKQSAQKQVKFVSLHKASLKKVFISSSSQK